ncbi:Transcriptional activator hac1 [Pseudocercospora fuligena]|uniref:Transcriptional activator hac1 n=1 Tax=Pseudocercospora fuligena TaxID=685502 RepID=A0A8H6RK92_9PEZI|nr:Transcriptional activator hac1 [Pseudocercospora fuligena]
MEIVSTVAPITTTMSFDHSSHTLKMEDFHQSSTSPAPSDSMTIKQHSSSPPPRVIEVQSRPAKKRKSWGQELPEPKTTLPPRKRAKTEDEKEQRRIERIKRNRAAAHNSRERKRQETEVLAVALAKANAELEAYRRLHGPLPEGTVLPEVKLVTEGNDVAVAAATPAPSLVESHGSQGDAPSPSSPADDIFQLQQQPIIKQEQPLDNWLELPQAFENLDEKSSVFTSLGQAQDSAEILCDLQCRPSSKNHSSTSLVTQCLANLLLAMVNSYLRQCQLTILTTLWTESPLRMEALTRLFKTRSSLSTLSSRTPLSRSTHRRQARHLAATVCASRKVVQRSETEIEDETTRDVQAGQTQALPEKGASMDMAYDSGYEDDDGEGVGETGLT